MYRVQYRPSYQSWERVLNLVTSMMVLRIFGRFFIFDGFFIFGRFFCSAPKAAADLCYAKLKIKNLRPYGDCMIVNNV